LTRVLALDTSTWWGSVALVEVQQEGSETRPRVVAEEGARVDGSHAERLLPWIERLLAGAGWSKTSLDAYAATRGPGSFTGVRVGLGTIRGLSLAAGRPCFGVTTLEAIAEAHGPAGLERIPVMDAGRGELYAARYDADSSPPVEVEAAWLGAAPLVLSRAEASRGLLLRGPGLQIELPPDTPLTVAASAIERLAGAAGCLVGRRVACGTDFPEPLAPLYLRLPDALLKRARE
jgi:tRNA threonylcarbamoyladenosine biosynthesis protein TsaB